MKTLRQHLERLRKVKRHQYHHLIHKIHKRHNVSKKTLFYVKEYGPHTHVANVIIRESFKILLLASIISSFGGLALEQIKIAFISVLPLVILLPALNDMIGDYGTIISSRFATLLHEGKIRGNVWKDKDMRKLFVQVAAVSAITTVLSAVIALIVSMFSGYKISSWIVAKLIFVVMLDVTIIMAILMFISVYAGLYYYRRKEDPNNFLIPITTSAADFGNMIVLSSLIIIFF